MTTGQLIPTLTTVLAALFALALFDQWRERRSSFQLVWALGMTWFALAAGAEALAGFVGWTDPLYRVWYLTGAVWTAGWLGLGTAFLLGKTQFGYAFALCLLLAGLFTFLTQRRFDYPGSGSAPVLYFIAAGVLGFAVGVETYFQNERWPRIAAIAVVGATILSLILMATTTLYPGPYTDPVTGAPTAALLPGTLRLLTPFMNITGALALALGAIFSTYVFMPKKRVLAYSLDPNQPGDQFLFNLSIAPFAIAVNFIASIPGAFRALADRTINSRVPATILIAIGAFIPTITDSLNRFGSTEYYQLGKLLGVIFLFAGFLVSIEVFSELRVPFTRIVLWRRHPAPAAEAAPGAHPVT